MKISKVSVRGFGPLGQARVEFAPGAGATSVSAPNGAGNTATFRALRAAFCGWSTTDSNRRQDAPVMVELDIERTGGHWRYLSQDGAPERLWDTGAAAGEVRGEAARLGLWRLMLGREVAAAETEALAPLLFFDPDTWSAKAGRVSDTLDAYLAQLGRRAQTDPGLILFFDGLLAPLPLPEGQVWCEKLRALCPDCQCIFLGASGTPTDAQWPGQKRITLGRD